jgi:DNA-binding GntR family transcriptional regulator
MIYESELVERYQVSRTPVREALTKLIQEGLVLAIPSVGHQVAPISMDDLREFVDMRIILECAAVERAATRMTPEHVRELSALADTKGSADIAERLRDVDSTRKWYEENTAFHVKLAECSGNRLLVQSIRRLMENAYRFYFVSAAFSLRVPRHVHHHREIVSALCAGDADRALELSRIDILSTIDDLEVQQAEAETTVGNPGSLGLR